MPIQVPSIQIPLNTFSILPEQHMMAPDDGVKSGYKTPVPTTQTEPTSIRKTPFPTPSDSTTIPPAPTLTPTQESKYTDLLQSTRSWASKQPLTEQEQSWLTRECLLRYLRASSWNLATARKRVEATVNWRRSYGVDSKLTPDYISIENETGKQWIVGFDLAGRPCLYLNPQNQNTEKTARQIEHLVFMLERCLDLTPPGQESLAILMNFADTKMGQGASIAQGRETLNILQNHYPERLGRAVLINRMFPTVFFSVCVVFFANSLQTVPWHISAFMKIILPFVDPVTKAKIIINQPMADHVPSEQLIVSHGGTLQFEYEHEVYWPALTELAASRRKEQFERWVAGGRHVGELEAYLKGGLEVGVGGGDGGIDGKIVDEKDVTVADEKDVQPVDEQDSKEKAHIAGEVNGGAICKVDGMTEKVVERDGETFEDAVEAVEKVTI